jgi:hypothetical protein
VINGAGLRKRAFFKVYAIGLYLPQKAAGAADAINAKGAKRVAIVTLRDLTAEQFVDALVEALKNNHDEAALKALQPKIDQFRAAMLTIGNAPEKSAVNLDWLPESGTRLDLQRRAEGRRHPRRGFLPRPAAHLARRQAGAGRPQGTAARQSRWLCTASRLRRRDACVANSRLAPSRGGYQLARFART